MSDTARAGREFGEGPLARAVALIYTLLVVEALFLLAALPGLVPLVLLGRDVSNLPLVACCALPVGPALSAAVYALRRRGADLTDLRPAGAFWRGYRLNVLGVLQVWVPWLAWLTVIAVSLAHFDATGLPGWWAALLVLVALVLCLWVANVLVITSLFAFRARDTARLAWVFLLRTPGVTLANACLMVVAAGVVFAFSEAVLSLLGSLLAAGLLRNARPMTDAIRREFIA